MSYLNLKINIQKNNLIVGRVAAALYLIFKTNFENAEVIIPGNICYAGIYPIIYSGNKPIFSDVDDESGNMTLKEIKKVTTKNTKAIIYPYMYGNVSREIFEIKEYCKNNNIIFIEDCASSMGAMLEGDILAGSIGDYSVFSTGHAKILDLGNGGILFTNRSIDAVEELNNKLPEFNETIKKEQEEFDARYRQIRYKYNNDAKISREFFSQDHKNMFLYKANEEIKKSILENIDRIDDIVEERKNKNNLYMSLLKENERFKMFKYNEGSVPWRFSIFVHDIECKRQLINELLKNNLFVSDWYPCISQNFVENKYCKNAVKMGNQILNFSLITDEKEIKKTCECINNFWKGKD